MVCLASLNFTLFYGMFARTPIEPDAVRLLFGIPWLWTAC